MHDDDNVAHDRFDRYGRLESRMESVEKRQTRLEDAHTEQERAFYGYPDPNAPNGFVPGVIQRMFDAVALGTAKIESMEQTASNFARTVRAAAKIVMRVCWTIVCGCAIAFCSAVAWVASHWTAVEKLLDSIGRVMQ